MIFYNRLIIRNIQLAYLIQMKRYQRLIKVKNSHIMMMMMGFKRWRLNIIIKSFNENSHRPKALKK